MLAQCTTFFPVLSSAPNCHFIFHFPSFPLLYSSMIGHVFHSSHFLFSVVFNLSCFSICIYGLILKTRSPRSRESPTRSMVSKLTVVGSSNYGSVAVKLIVPCTLKLNSFHSLLLFIIIISFKNEDVGVLRKYFQLMKSSVKL